MGQRLDATLNPRPSGKFSLPGMLLTLLVGLMTAIATGLIFYALSSVLPFSVPMLFPAIMGGIVGFVAMRMGSTIGRCRNWVLAVTVAAIAGAVAVGTGHVADYWRFRIETAKTIVADLPWAEPDSVDYVIDTWLEEETGHPGIVGFILLKSAHSSGEITSYRYGAPVFSFGLSGTGLMSYWLVEVLVSSGIAGLINRSYARVPYCDKCNAWRQYQTALVGTMPGVAEAIQHLKNRDIPAAMAALTKHKEGDVARFEIEFCPVCYDSALTRLVVVEDTGARTWLEKTVWSDKLEPQHSEQILELAD